MTRRVLITGASGFVGRHLVVASRRAGDEVIALTRAHADLRNSAATRSAIRDAAPDVVYHLAALSSVARSWDQPGEVLDENVRTALNVLEAVRLETPEARVVAVSSGEVYGRPDTLPTTEHSRLSPQNPYAVSKAAADLLAGQYADAHGLRVMRPRPFNHAGPGQSATFAIASFTRQVADARRAGQRRIRLVTGNPDARRDYTDVRDVVRAYRDLAGDPEPGAYNVCSGRSASAGDIIEILRRLIAPAGIEHVVDQDLLRPNDTPEIRGSFDLLAARTGWQPEIPLEKTIADTLAWWESEQ